MELTLWNWSRFRDKVERTFLNKLLLTSACNLEIRCCHEQKLFRDDWSKFSSKIENKIHDPVCCTNSFGPLSCNLSTNQYAHLKLSGQHAGHCLRSGQISFAKAAYFSRAFREVTCQVLSVTQKGHAENYKQSDE